MDNNVTIELKNDLAELERMADFIQRFGEFHHLPGKVVHTINLVLDELVTNVISYGYRDSNEHTILLRLSLIDGELTAELEDDGVPFDPLQRPEPDTTLPLEQRPIGGLGVHFARKMMDELAYERLQDRNWLVMKRRISDGNQ